MADNTSIAAYNKTGFGQTSGVADVKAQLPNYATDDASLRAQAEAQYAGTYDAQQKSYQTQIAGLIKAQTDDSELLNKQYEQSMSSMMAKLQQRGLNVGSLPGAQNAALDKFRNEVMTQRQTIYGNQQNAVKANQRVHAESYEANVQARMHENRSYNLGMVNQLLTTIAELQNSSYQAYIDYLLEKKAASRRSSSSRSYSSGTYNPSPAADTQPKSALDPSYFKNQKKQTVSTNTGGYVKQNAAVNKLARYSAVKK